jgi:hypothetical protein
MSFVNLMGNDVWSEADIINRTESMIASQFPLVEILRRKVLGQMEGQYALTPAENDEYLAYKMYTFQMGMLAGEARADMARLQQAMAVENGTLALDDAPDDVKALVAQRAQ